MEAKIHLKPENVWAFWEKNKERLQKEMVLVAQSDENKIYLSSENNLPYIYAYKGETLDGREGMVNRMDASDTAYSFYSKYLVKKSADAPPVSEEDDDEVEDEMDVIYEREDALAFAFRDFMQVVLEASEEEIDEFSVEDMDSMLDSVLKVLSDTDHNLLIYRPTMMEDENGQEYVEEYPYAW